MYAITRAHRLVDLSHVINVNAALRHADEWQGIN